MPDIHPFTLLTSAHYLMQRALRVAAGMTCGCILGSSASPSPWATRTQSGASMCSKPLPHLPALLAPNEVLSPRMVAWAASNLFPAGSRALLSIPIELSLMGFNFNLLLLENTDGDPPLPPA